MTIINKMVFQDISNFKKIRSDIAKKFFDDIPEDILNAEPLIYCHFATGIGDPKYMPVCTCS